MADARKLSIVFVRRGYSRSGGAEAYLKRLGQALAGLGHEAQLLATSDWPKTQWPFGPITHLRAGSPIAFADELEKLRPQLRCDVLMSFDRLWRCDVYRAGDGVHAAWLERRRKFQMPLERFLHHLNPKHRDILQLEESLLAQRSASRVVVNSHMVKKEIVGFYAYPEEKIDLVRNGVPLENFVFDPVLREQARAELKFKPDEIVLLFAGSGWERKGLLFAIEAIALCKNRQMHLLVAGRGNTRSYKAKRVHFLGERADLAPIYAAADIFILPTIYDPFSNACLEALASGLPVITTRDNGFSEIIEHELHGSIVDHPNDLMRLRDAIQFWSDSPRRAAARSAILERASQFDFSKSVDQTLAILAVTDGHAPSCP
jgi:UDP-glucose:(heptosyl)LPS alpha-1,3-glucosyltransferase